MRSLGEKKSYDGDLTVLTCDLAIKGLTKTNKAKEDKGDP
jgi:hypothetical protein